ncbi:MAG: TetR/AcrR family transcriptional regulator, partial [Spongiibacteraceae bacterium]
MIASKSALPEVLKPRRVPRQCRSRILVDSIKQACLKLMTEEPRAALTATRIADVTGVTIGSLYQYFPSVDAIIAAIFEDHMRDGADKVQCMLQTTWTQKPLEKCIQDFVWGIFNHYGACILLSPNFRRRHLDSLEKRDWLDLGQQGRDTMAGILLKLLLLHRPHLSSAEMEFRTVLVAGMLRG